MSHGYLFHECLDHFGRLSPGVGKLYSWLLASLEKSPLQSSKVGFIRNATLPQESQGSAKLSSDPKASHVPECSASAGLVPRFLQGLSCPPLTRVVEGVRGSLFLRLCLSWDTPGAVRAAPRAAPAGRRQGPRPSTARSLLPGWMKSSHCHF